MQPHDHPPGPVLAPLPHLHLYTRPGCHLCDDAREILRALLEERRREGRPVPVLEERNIESDPSWLREHLTTIPVVELGSRRIELAIRPSALRRLLADELDPLPGPERAE